MKRLQNCVLAVLMGCSVPILIWVGAASALYQNGKRVKLSEKALMNLACFIDSDCPQGYVCVNGRCQPQTT